jgi:hypothetical protein
MENPHRSLAWFGRGFTVFAARLFQRVARRS